MVESTEYPVNDDFAIPSCLVLGKDRNGNVIHVVDSSEGNVIYLNTAYRPDITKWTEDYRHRKRGVQGCDA